MTNEARKPQSPFRRQALEYIATPKALDDLIQVTSPLAWASTLALWLIVGGIVLWLFLGSIVTHIAGKGVVLTDNTAVVYVSALEVRRLSPGMQVHVSPSTIKRWKYHRISGRVLRVEIPPATPNAMLAILKNSSLVDYFLRAGPVTTVYLQLAVDSRANKVYSLPPGSLIDAQIVMRRQTPLSLILSR